MKTSLLSYCKICLTNTAWVAPVAALFLAPDASAELIRTLGYHQITSFGQDDYFGARGQESPIISRQGNKIAFAHAPGTESPDDPNRIFVMNPDGTGQSQVDSYTTYCYCGSYVDISDDGTSVISSDAVQLRISDSGGGRSLVALDSNEINGIKITGDGTKVFFRLGRDTSIRGSNPSIAMPRGIWVINASGSGLHRIVGVNEMAAVLGIQATDVSFFQADFGVDASADGSHVIFGTLVSPQSGGDGQGLFAVNGNGSGLRNLSGRVNRVFQAAINADGSKVAYNFYTSATNIKEIGVLNFDGSGKLKLTDDTVAHGSTGAALPDETERMQLTSDGSKLLVSGNGLLYNTDGSGVLQLNMRVPDYSTGVSMLLGPGLYQASMNGDGTRFTYVSDRPRQIQTADLNPTSVGAAPTIAGYSITPDYVFPTSGGTKAIARLTPANPLVVNLSFVRQGLEDVPLEDPDGYENLYLTDDGTRGDATAHDGVFTNAQLHSGPDSYGKPQAVGPRTVRLEAASKSSDGRLHGYAVEFAPFAVVVQPRITSATSDTATVGQLFVYNITVSGFDPQAQITYSATNLPPGLSLDPHSGKLSGYPQHGSETKSQPLILALSATNGDVVAQATMALTIADSSTAPTITSPATAELITEVSYSYQIVGTHKPTSYSATGPNGGPLPAGLSVNSTTGIVSGTFSASGTFSILVSATNAKGVSYQTITLKVDAANASTTHPVVFSPSSATGKTGSPFYYRIDATGDLASFLNLSGLTFGADNLPPGLTLNSSGEIIGTPSQAGEYLVQLTINGTIAATLQLTISGDTLFPLISSPTIAFAQPGHSFMFQIQVSGTQPGDPVIFSYSGFLPQGLTFDPKTGTFSGTLPNRRRSTVTAAATDDSHNAPLVAYATNSHGTASSQLKLTISSTPPISLLNISTRMEVLTGDNVLIAGFIITGSESKKVLVRGLGPSLTSVAGRLQDPTLGLHHGSSTVATNDNWKENRAAVEATTIPPSNDLESAIVSTLDPGAYTAILADKNGATGVGLVEVYDLSQSASARLANISTRGFVDRGDNVMIGGVIAGPNTAGSIKVLLRAIGPSLGISGQLGDPTLELHNANGATVASNDNWKIDDKTGASQQAAIEATTVPPKNDHESALLQTIAPGNYTAIVRGKNNTAGVGLVEVYNLQ